MRPDVFEKKKKGSLSHEVIKLGRLVNQQGLSIARKKFKLPQLRQAHLDMFPHIDFAGTSISEISKRKGVSKQSVSKVVQEMVELKILTIQPCPEDSRSKLVFFKTSGPFAIQKGFGALEAIDEEMSRFLGKKSYVAVLRQIGELRELLESES